MRKTNIFVIWALKGMSPVNLNNKIREKNFDCISGLKCVTLSGNIIKKKTRECHSNDDELIGHLVNLFCNNVAAWRQLYIV
jgi:hypothetical protein